MKTIEMNYEEIKTVTTELGDLNYFKYNNETWVDLKFVIDNECNRDIIVNSPMDKRLEVNYGFPPVVMYASTLEYVSGACGDKLNEIIKGVLNTNDVAISELVKVEVKTIGEDDVNAVDARELWMFLESKRDFSNWIKNRINKYGFTIGVDFISFNNYVESNSKARIEYTLTIEMAMVLSMGEKNPKGAHVYKYFCSILGKEVLIKHQKRVEYQFEEVINNLFSSYKVVSQYPVLKNKYRIDWYIPELKLAIEFDELHHRSSTNDKNDKKRQTEIEAKLGCKFARYKL